MIRIWICDETELDRVKLIGWERISQHKKKRLNLFPSPKATKTNFSFSVLLTLDVWNKLCWIILQFTFITIFSFEIFFFFLCAVENIFHYFLWKLFYKKVKIKGHCILIYFCRRLRQRKSMWDFIHKNRSKVREIFSRRKK